MSIESAIKAIHAAGLSDTNGEKILGNDQLRRIVELVLSEHLNQTHESAKVDRDLEKEARNYLATVYAEYGDEESAKSILAGGFDRRTYFPIEAIKKALMSEISNRSVDLETPKIKGLDCTVSHRAVSEKGEDGEQA